MQSASRVYILYVCIEFDKNQQKQFVLCGESRGVLQKARRVRRRARLMSSTISEVEEEQIE